MAGFPATPDFSECIAKSVKKLAKIKALTFIKFRILLSKVSHCQEIPDSGLEKNTKPSQE
ncbi:MAG: hypothetical protein GY760_09315 [Deltaproteobacteria bacterium]|nr:hypothetical protein [Deltaproteobacteria bacterium]